MESQEDLTQKFSISDFKNFIAIPLSCPDSKPISRLHVFSKPHQESEPRKPTSNFSHTITKKKIKRALELFEFLHFPTLAQFWAPTITENQQEFLVTYDLPFGISGLQKGLCLFRKHCLEHRYCVDGVRSGAPGRVFRQRFPEFCPDVGCYSAEEFELKDLAADMGIRGYLALPVFEPDWQCCIGVLEILTVMDGSYCLTDVIVKVSDSLKEVGLSSSEVFWPFDMKKLPYNQSGNGPPEYELALNEIQKVLDVLCKTYRLPFAQTWIITLDESSSESIMSTSKMGSNKKVSSFQKDCTWFHLRKGQGIVWKAFSSGTCCFCRDITQLSIHDYSLVLSARKADLTGAFAISLQSTYTGNAAYVIELGLPRKQTIYGKPTIFLSSLFVKMKEQFKTFKLSSGQELGNELRVEVLKVSKDDTLDAFLICQTMPDGEGLDTASSSSLFECSLNGGEMLHLHDSTHNRRHELNVRRNIFPPLRENGAAKTLSLEEAVSPKVLKVQSGKRLREFPDNPSVSRQTLENLSTERNINRLVPMKRSRVDHSHMHHKSIKEAEEDIIKSSQRRKSYSVSPLEEGPASVSSLTPIATPMQNEGRIITVKADFKGDIIKFQLSVSSGMMELKDEVMKRLKLTSGAFEVKYRREDGVWVPLDSDAGLEEYVNAMRSLDDKSSMIKLSIVSVVPEPEATRNAVNSMTVKASYKDDTIKFLLSRAEGMSGLKNEVIKRLKLETESFEIKYANENNCHILLDSDAALLDCISTVTLLRKTTMKLLILPIRAVSDEFIMTVKAFYGDDILKFQLSVSSGMMKLKDELTKRLKLEDGSFVIEYPDGNHSKILLNGDADLTKYMSTMASTGTHKIKIFLKPTVDQ